jgi:hypothetical protein
MDGITYNSSFGKNTYLLTYLLTYSMEQSPSWEGNWFEASQEIPRIIWNPKVHYRIHKCRATCFNPEPAKNPVHPSTSLLFGNNDLVKVFGAESEVVIGECEKCASRCFDISIPAEILRKK